jgi:hypothetical protein
MTSGLPDLVGLATRVIEIAPESTELATHLGRLRDVRYLGLVPHTRLEAMRRHAGIPSARFQPLTEADGVVRNDTDLLVLHGDHVRRMWQPSDLHHVTHVAFEPGISAPAVEARVAQTLGWISGRMRPLGSFRCGLQRLQVAEIVTHEPLAVRRYLSPVWGVRGLAERLERLGIRYVVLRWFEDLPRLEPGEDLDVLVADEDLDKFRRLLAEEPGTIPVDLYSVSGMDGSGYQGIAYYPPALAERMLDRSVVHRSGFRVPAPEDHVHSLAYHAVYHKGHRSGIASSLLDAAETDPEHDYASVLRGLAGRVEIDLPDSLEDLDEYLAREGWRPPQDTFVRLSATNRWIDRSLAVTDAVEEPPEVAVFVLRERARDVVSASEVTGLLDHYGFEVLAFRELDAGARARCSFAMRGGNWGRGPYPDSAGGPVRVIVAVHYGPHDPDAADKDCHPHLSNADTLEAKRRLRELVNARLEPVRRCNPVHSSDNAREAWDYVDLALPDELGRLREAVQQRREEFRSPPPIVDVLSHGRRGKVELIEYRGEFAVRKTFGRGYLRYLEREIAGMTDLGPHVAEVPPVLQRGPNWFLCPYYEDSLRSFWGSGRLLPLRVLDQMIRVLREIHDLGYALIDAKPENFVLDPHRGMKVIDFEFLHRYVDGLPPFSESYSLVGAPAGFTGDLPVGPWSYGDAASSYEWNWLKYTGLSLEALLGSPRWSQHLQRGLFRVAGTVPDRSVPPRTLRVRSRRVLGRVYRGATRRYSAWARRRATDL